MWSNPAEELICLWAQLPDKGKDVNSPGGDLSTYSTFCWDTTSNKIRNSSTDDSDPGATRVLIYIRRYKSNYKSAK